MMGRADQHEVGRRPAHLCARHHEPEVVGLGMLATHLKAVIHSRAQAGLVAG